MELKGLRGSASTRIDDKGRLKIPSIFRSVIQDRHGADVFVTSLTGECVLIYPLQEWVALEQRLLDLPEQLPERLKFLELVNYFGQEGELDSQGRVLIPTLIRSEAEIAGEVRVYGRITHLEVWNASRVEARNTGNRWTREDGERLSNYTKRLSSPGSPGESR